MPSLGREDRRCKATKRDGTPCTRWAIRGATVCGAHGGKAPQVRKMAMVRAELEYWGVADATADVDPGEVLLRLLSQAVARAEQYAAKLAGVVSEAGDLHQALVGDRMVISESGQLTKIDEYVRGLARLEAEERDRAANFATKAIAAGLAERQVRLAEKQGALIADVLRLVLADASLGLTEQQRAAVPDVLRRHLSIAS